MTVPLPQPGTLPAVYGFRDGARGTHTSRTIMLADLTTLLAAFPVTAEREEFRTTIIADNLLRKKTVSTRRLSATRLGEMYALDPRVVIYRVMRQLWDTEEEGQPLLACLCANARDPLLRMTSGAVLPVPEGTPVPTESIFETLTTTTGDRFNPNTRHEIARNAASSWTQSGHLAGRGNKVRVQAVATPATAAYALLLGYLSGVRGVMLFSTYWTLLLDASPSTIDALAFEASRRGWIDYRRIDAVVQIGFSGLLTAQEQEAIRGQD